MGIRTELGFLVFAFIIFACLRDAHTVTSSTDMKTHLDTILPTSGATPYYDYMRPIANQDNAVDVTADLYLVAINAFDDTEQKLTTTSYLEVTWADEVMNGSNICLVLVYVYGQQVMSCWDDKLVYANRKHRPGIVPSRKEVAGRRGCLYSCMFAADQVTLNTLLINM